MSGHEDPATRAKKAFDAFERARERVEISAIEVAESRRCYAEVCRELADARAVLLAMLTPDMLPVLTNQIKADVSAQHRLHELEPHNPDPTSTD